VRGEVDVVVLLEEEVVVAVAAESARMPEPAPWDAM
jgi:hypothetical protein